MIPVRFISKISNCFSTRYKITTAFYDHFVHYSSQTNYALDLKINQINLTSYISKLEQEYKNLSKEPNISRRMELTPVIKLLEQRQRIIDDIFALREFLDSKEQDVSSMAKEEKKQFENQLEEIDRNLVEAVLPVDPEDFCNSIILEVQAGIGGQEAMIFAEELFNMYQKFSSFKGWEWEIVEFNDSDAGGIRHGSLLIRGPQVFKYFKCEGGVHRVQRVPDTDKRGRIHTSTVSVIALPQPNDIEVNIHQKDLKIETKRATGAGGQHVNTTDSAVRITHLPTNTTVECQVDRSQIKNRKLALARLSALLYQKEVDNQLKETQAARKSQVKSNNRNEKIRTYNYNQDRITDHRYQIHYHNLKQFLEGGVELNELIEQIDKQKKMENLINIVNE